MRKIKKLVFIIFIMFVCVGMCSNVRALKCKYGQGHKTFNVEYKYDKSKGNYALHKVYLTTDVVKNSEATATYKKWFDVEIKDLECPTIKVDGSKLSFFSKELESTDTSESLQMKQDLGGCSGYTYETSCMHNDYYACIWNDNEFGEYCNTDKLVYVRCGDIFDIPHEVPGLFSFFVNLFKIAAPIILIIVSIISLLKALSASSEDEIKKAQKGLIKKIIAGVMVFFIISIVQFVVLKVADTDDSEGTSEADNLSECLTCFLNNDCGSNSYYKTSVGGYNTCTYFSTDSTEICD